MDLRSKLKRGKLTVGSWITIGDESVAEIMANAGFDWLTIDMEHSAITLDKAQNLIRVIDLCGVTPLVRVSENDPTLIKRVMDAGSHGVIVPMVNSSDDAEAAVKAVKYPPTGKRGVGLARAQGYGLKFEAYKKWLRENSMVIVQIEHIEGVKNLEEILSVKGVDAFMVGPYDLSASLGYPGEFDRPGMRNALKKIMSVSKRLKVSAGFHVVQPDIGALKQRVGEGFSFIAYSFDALFLAGACGESIANIRGLRKR
ncbi:MAG: aldolase/citrate lyase family protein [Candidatus Omnitrophota bacterium]